MSLASLGEEISTRVHVPPGTTSDPPYSNGSYVTNFQSNVWSSSAGALNLSYFLYNPLSGLTQQNVVYPPFSSSVAQGIVKFYLNSSSGVAYITTSYFVAGDSTVFSLV